MFWTYLQAAGEVLSIVTLLDNIISILYRAMAEQGQTEGVEKPIRCFVVGDNAVGKSCLLISYCFNRFPKEYEKVPYLSYIHFKISRCIWNIVFEYKFVYLTVLYLSKRYIKKVMLRRWSWLVILIHFACLNLSLASSVTAFQKQIYF